MDVDDIITVTKVDIGNGNCYLMIGWQSNSFEIYLYINGKLWKGSFSSNRLAGFSRNLHMTETDYFACLKKCLSQKRDNYHYELKSGIFYWKRKLKDSVIIEGFLPMEEDKTSKSTQPDLVEVLLAVNAHLKDKIKELNYNFETMKKDYHKCLRDTEEFLNLKIDMEKSLCDKFLSLLNLKKSKVESLYEK